LDLLYGFWREPVFFNLGSPVINLGSGLGSFTKMTKRARSQSRSRNSLSTRQAVLNVGGRLVRRGGQYVLNRASDYVVNRVSSYVNGRMASPAVRTTPPSRVSVARTVRRPHVARRLNFGRAGSRTQRHHTVGRLGRMFPKRAKFGTANRFIKNGYIRKREVGGVVTDGQCVYVGHNSNAMGDHWVSMVYAVMRWFAKKIGHDYVAVDDGILGGLVNPNLQWVIYYKTGAENVITTAAVASSTPRTWGNWADQLSTLITNAIGTNDYFELCSIALHSLDNIADTPDIPYTIIQVKQLFVTVVGNSNLVLQNTTLSSIADADGDVIDNVSNNPLTGKMYSGLGQSYPMAAQYNVSGANRAILTDPDSGFMTYNITQDSGMSLSMRNLVTKPPPHFAFHGMKGSVYVNLKPGEIRRSKTVKAYKYDFCKWIQLLIPYLKTSPEGNRNSIKFMGVSKVFGFERLLDSRSDEATIRVAYEINLTTSAIAEFRPTMKALPQLFVQPQPV
jgi:hypothetical protein